MITSTFPYPTTQEIATITKNCLMGLYVEVRDTRYPNFPNNNYIPIVPDMHHWDFAHHQYRSAYSQENIYGKTFTDEEMLERMAQSLQECEG
tara:strand:+ start:589 stop:864 length:276 start_codon:yes stop_codon:yes gene_type:complete